MSTDADDNAGYAGDNSRGFRSWRNVQLYGGLAAIALMALGWVLGWWRFP